MAKKRIKKIETDATLTPIKLKEPASDMWAIYELVGQRLIDEGIMVNSDTLPEVEIGKNFVDNCMAMIPQNTGGPPEYAPFNFTARMTCIVAKGYETGTRLEILKNAVRAAFMKGPLVLRNFNISPTVVGEADTREVGVRKSELTVVMKVEKINKKR
jgi:hypothetical protein